ncbi:uncharacterized protein UHOD_12044 [Ustilago sp. UG-2017b]|nr:uncharacterized protein UHOD_12044 [Ustilago sp. UG-2017b]
MPPRVDSVALLECTMQMIREAHADWDEDQVLECAFSVMNLQPNASQAEKIPKSVLSIISQIVKLNENNWAIWEPMFMDCIHPIKNARRILTGEIPSGHTDYDEELDVMGLNAQEVGRSISSYEGSAGIRELGRSCSMTDLAKIGRQPLTEDTRQERRSPLDGAGALHDDEVGAIRWAPALGGSEGHTCEEQDQALPRRGPSSGARSWLPLRGSQDRGQENCRRLGGRRAVSRKPVSWA